MACCIQYAACRFTILHTASSYCMLHHKPVCSIGIHALYETFARCPDMLQAVGACCGWMQPPAPEEAFSILPRWRTGGTHAPVAPRIPPAVSQTTRDGCWRPCRTTPRCRPAAVFPSRPPRTVSRRLPLLLRCARFDSPRPGPGSAPQPAAAHQTPCPRSPAPCRRPGSDQHPSPAGCKRRSALPGALGLVGFCRHGIGGAPPCRPLRAGHLVAPPACCSVTGPCT